MLSSMMVAGLVGAITALDDFELGPEDYIQLLQVQAKKHNSTAMDSTETDLPLNHRMVFDSCANFGGASEIIGSGGAFNPSAEDTTFNFCRCWGDTHCSSVPFDLAESAINGRGGRTYQYDGPGASRYAKAADGSWEIQIFQCGNANHRSFHPSGQVGVAVKAGGTVVEVGMPVNGANVKCYVNGELQPPGYEVHLPTGFHIKCPEAAPSCNNPRSSCFRRRTTTMGTFCAVQDGQFVANANHFEWGTQMNQVLAVPKTVDVQAASTICYDPANKDGAFIHTGRQMSLNSIVSAEEVIFSQTMIDYMSSNPQCYLQDPPQSGVPAGESADPEPLCNERGPGAWQHAQDNCAPLQENHPAFYSACLLDECVRYDDSEEAVIAEIAESDEPTDDEASAAGDPHITTMSGGRFDLES